MAPSHKDTEISRRRMMQTAALLAAGGLGSTAGCVGTGDDDSGSGNGNGNGNGNGDDNGMEGPSMADEIEVWGWDIAARSLELTAEEYMSEVGATINVSEFGRGAMKDDLNSNLAAGNGAPAVAMLESIDAPARVETPGGIRDLSGRIEEAGIRDDFVSGKWEALDVNGGTYAVPWDIGPTGVFYRRSIYEEHGIDPDSIETYEDFLAEGEKLPDDVAMFNIPPNDINGQWRFMCRQQGMNPITDDGAINIASEESLRAARTLKDLHDAGITSRLDGWSAAWFTAYNEGDIASLPSAAWMEGTMRAELGDTGGDWGVYKIPAFESGGNRASNWGGSNLMIPEQVGDDKAERAWDYIEFTLANEEMQLLMFEEYGLFPALETTYEDPTFDEELDFFGGQQIRSLFAEVASEAPGWRFSPATPNISDAIEAEFEKMLQGDQSPEDAVQNAADTVASETGRDVA
jgi:multiple sugar transport system substrate-binding protein/lactose/L-arabinose transport system substrate-binding protein